MSSCPETTRQHDTTNVLFFTVTMFVVASEWGTNNNNDNKKVKNLYPHVYPQCLTQLDEIYI